jgi:hypothetical protein
MNEAIPTFVALAIALIGGAGGIAALMKVNADNSKVVSEGATNVVKMLREQIDDLDSRLNSLEVYADAIETWAGQVTDLLEKTVDAMPESKQPPFRREAQTLVATRPRRRRPVVSSQ